MIKVELEGKKYNLPTSWEDVSIKKYKKIFNIDSEDGDITYFVTLLSILLDIPYDILIKIEYSSLTKLQNSINFIHEPIIQDSITEFEIDGVKYKLTNITNLKTNEFVDLDSLSKDYINNMHLMLGIIYRECDSKGKIVDYDSDDLNRRSIIFDDKLNILQVNKTIVFFSKIVTLYLNTMNSYLAKRVTKEMKMMKTKKQKELLKLLAKEYIQKLRQNLLVF
jgi:hypothetical protein